MNQTDLTKRLNTFTWIFLFYCALSLYFMFRHWHILQAVLNSQAAGEPELYPHQYRGLIHSAYKGMVSDLLLPAPLLIGWFERQKQRRPMFISIAVFVIIFVISLIV